MMPGQVGDQAAVGYLATGLHQQYFQVNSALLKHLQNHPRRERVNPVSVQRLLAAKVTQIC